MKKIFFQNKNFTINQMYGFLLSVVSLGAIFVLLPSLAKASYSTLQLHVSADSAPSNKVVVGTDANTGCPIFSGDAYPTCTLYTGESMSTSGTFSWSGYNGSSDTLSGTPAVGLGDPATQYITSSMPYVGCTANDPGYPYATLANQFATSFGGYLYCDIEYHAYTGNGNSSGSAGANFTIYASPSTPSGTRYLFAAGSSNGDTTGSPTFYVLIVPRPSPCTASITDSYTGQNNWTISWSISNGTLSSVSNIPGAVGAVGNATNEGPNTYTVTGTGLNGGASCSASVTTAVPSLDAKVSFVATGTTLAQQTGFSGTDSQTGPTLTSGANYTINFSSDAATFYPSVISCVSNSGYGGSAFNPLVVNSASVGSYTYSVTCGRANTSVAYEPVKNNFFAKIKSFFAVDEAQAVNNPSGVNCAVDDCVTATITGTVTASTPPGACGSGASYANGKTYPYGTAGYGTDSQCQSGTPSDTSFPAVGASVSWTCSGNPASGTCTASQGSPGAPTASLTVNGASNVTVTPGTALNYVWSSTSGSTWSSSYTVSPSDACSPQNISGTTYSWVANSAVGSTSVTAANCMATNSTTYTITYLVTNSVGATASATVQVKVIPAGTVGVCGSASGHAFASTDTTWSPYTQCASGSPSNTTFPSVGGSQSWTCSGSPSSGTCTASRQNVAGTPGACGTANNHAFASTDTTWSPYTQCTSGTSSNTGFFQAGSPQSWTCSGSPSASCSATKTAAVGGSCSLFPTLASYTAPASIGIYYLNSLFSDPHSWCVVVSPISGGTVVNYGPSSPGFSELVDNNVTSTGVKTYTMSCSYIGSTLTYSCSTSVTVNAGGVSCPAGTVSLTSSGINTGQTTTASAPTGFSGGSFASSNSAVASVSGSTVSGVTAGSANITGSGWNNSNGATNCNLSSASITVSNIPPIAPVSLSLTTGSSCGTTSSTWPSVVGATSYNLYRNTVNSTSTATKIASVTSPKLDSGLVAGNYYYWITAVNAGGESAYTPANSNASGGVPALSCNANLLDSDKDIVAINNALINPVPGQCNGTDALPASTIINLGDKLKFQINLCNDQGNSTASNITLTDNLINLSKPSTGWTMQYNGTTLAFDSAHSNTLSTPCSPSANSYCSFGVAPNQGLVVNLTSATKNISAGGAGKLTFEAVTNVSSSFSGNRALFQNSFTISYNNGTTQTTATGHTPYLPFYIGSGSPIIREVP